MIWIGVLGLFLLCGAMILVLSVYMLMLWCAGHPAAEEEAAAAVEGEERGFTEEELEKLEEGKVGAGGEVECAVCLEEIVEGQVARVLPGCDHAFHRPCADAWLQTHPSCPLCRARLLRTPSQSQVTSSTPSP